MNDDVGASTSSRWRWTDACLNWLQLDPRMNSLRKASCSPEVAQRLYKK